MFYLLYLSSDWSKIHKIKIQPIDSIILRNSKNEDEFSKKIFEWLGYKELKLLYRGSEDGVISKIFHDKSDNKVSTVCLYENENRNIFEGYASISWTNDGNSKKPASESFIFTITNIY